VFSSTCKIQVEKDQRAHILKKLGNLFQKVGQHSKVPVLYCGGSGWGSCCPAEICVLEWTRRETCGAQPTRELCIQYQYQKAIRHINVYQYVHNLGLRYAVCLQAEWTGKCGHVISLMT